VSSTGGRILGHLVKNTRRSWGRALRRHPALGMVLSIALAVVGVVMLGVGLLAENLLYYLATALSGLGSVAVARARHLERQRQQQTAARRPNVAQPRPQRPPGTTGSTGSTSADAPAASGVVVCTETGNPITECGCATRHVATAEGARRFGRPVGSPMGRRLRQTKPAATTKSQL
jgi:hypothetical protein